MPPAQAPGRRVIMRGRGACPAGAQLPSPAVGACRSGLAGGRPAAPHHGPQHPQPPGADGTHAGSFQE